jgi:hypothetical protein
MGLMPRALKAFISYRREDGYVQVAEDGKPGNSFILDLKAALLKAGFEAVFVDIEAMEGGDEFTDRIREEIKESDLFVAVIGKEWLNILNKRSGEPGPDHLLQEIVTALKNEKEILPVLVDGGAMPHEDKLPERISQLQHRHAISVRSADSVETIALKLVPSFKKTARTGKLKAIWRAAYI